MINNNTTVQKPIGTGNSSQTLSTVSMAEFQNALSSLKKEIGTISETKLKEWLEAHPYISENDIKSLIKTESPVVSNEINKGYINELKGEIVEIKDKMKLEIVGSIKLKELASKNEVNTIKTQISGINSQISKINNINIASEEWVEGKGYLTEHQSLDGLATEEWVESRGYLTEHQSLDGLATKNWVEGKGYLTEHQNLSPYAKKSWVEGKGYLTEHQSLDGLATEEWVKKQNYIAESKLNSTLGEYVKSKDTFTKKEINGLYLTAYDIRDTFITKNEVGSTYMPKTDIDKNYLKKSDAANTYLTKEDYRSLKSVATVSKQYYDKSIYDLELDLENKSFLDGLYVVQNGQTMVLVRDNQIIYIDGEESSYLFWTKDTSE